MAIAADDDVIVHGDAKRLPGFHDLAGYLDVGAARARIARGVVVDHPTELIIYLIFIVFSDGHLKVVPGFGSCA